MVQKVKIGILNQNANNPRLIKDDKFKKLVKSIQEFPEMLRIRPIEEQKEEFIVKDNVGFGDWDWDILANKWDNVKLGEWGMDVWQPQEDLALEDFFVEDKTEKQEEKNRIILEYSEQDYNEILDAFKKHNGTKEEIVFNLLHKECC